MIDTVILICTFYDLQRVMEPLHMNVKADVDRLHDIWKQGAPTPDSIIRNPLGYDPRKRQRGNMEKRMVMPSAFTDWVMDLSKRRGQACTQADARAMLTNVSRILAKG